MISDHLCVTIILATMLIWAPFSPSMSTFLSVLTPVTLPEMALNGTSFAFLSY